jgi:hypothetical protein
VEDILVNGGEIPDSSLWGCISGFYTAYYIAYTLFIIIIITIDGFFCTNYLIPLTALPFVPFFSGPISKMPYTGRNLPGNIFVFITLLIDQPDLNNNHVRMPYNFIQ